MLSSMFLEFIFGLASVVLIFLLMLSTGSLNKIIQKVRNRFRSMYIDTYIIPTLNQLDEFFGVYNTINPIKGKLCVEYDSDAKYILSKYYTQYHLSKIKTFKSIIIKKESPLIHKDNTIKQVSSITFVMGGFIYRLTHILIADMVDGVMQDIKSILLSPEVFSKDLEFVPIYQIGLTSSYKTPYIYVLSEKSLKDIIDDVEGKTDENE